MLAKPEGLWKEDPAGAITTQPACEEGTILSAGAEPWERLSRPRVAKSLPRILFQPWKRSWRLNGLILAKSKRGMVDLCSGGRGTPKTDQKFDALGAN